MEADINKENIKKNIAIIAWVLIGINIFSLYQVMNPEKQFELSVTGQNTYFDYAYVYVMKTFDLIDMLIHAAIIYFAVHTMQFNEKGRRLLSRLIIVNMITNAAAFIASFILSFLSPYGDEIRFYISFGLIYVLIKGIIFNAVVLTAFYMFYRYLNKPETKSVFEPKPVQQQEV